MSPVTTRSTCPYCGVGCGVLIESQGSVITGVSGDPQHPANLGRLCTRQTLHSPQSPPCSADAPAPPCSAPRGAPAQPMLMAR